MLFWLKRLTLENRICFFTLLSTQHHKFFRKWPFYLWVWFPIFANGRDNHVTRNFPAISPFAATRPFSNGGRNFSMWWVFFPFIFLNYGANFYTEYKYFTSLKNCKCDKLLNYRGKGRTLRESAMGLRVLIKLYQNNLSPWIDHFKVFSIFDFGQSAFPSTPPQRVPWNQ